MLTWISTYSWSISKVVTIRWKSSAFCQRQTAGRGSRCSGLEMVVHLSRTRCGNGEWINCQSMCRFISESLHPLSWIHFMFQRWLVRSMRCRVWKRNWMPWSTRQVHMMVFLLTIAVQAFLTCASNSMGWRRKISISGCRPSKLKNWIWIVLLILRLKNQVSDPVRRYGSVEADLFHAILNRCVGADQICMDKLMLWMWMWSQYQKRTKKLFLCSLRISELHAGRMLKCVQHHQLLLENKDVRPSDLTKLIFGRLSWEAIPLHEPILLATFAGVSFRWPA